MITYLMPLIQHALRDAWKAFNFAPDHEECGTEMVLCQYVQNGLCVGRWPVIECQSHCVPVSSAPPVRPAQPLRSHRVTCVINACRSHRQRTRRNKGKSESHRCRLLNKAFTQSSCACPLRSAPVNRAPGARSLCAQLGGPSCSIS